MSWCYSFAGKKYVCQAYRGSNINPQKIFYSDLPENLCARVKLPAGNWSAFNGYMSSHLNSVFKKQKHSNTYKKVSFLQIFVIYWQKHLRSYMILKGMTLEKSGNSNCVIYQSKYSQHPSCQIGTFSAILHSLFFYKVIVNTIHIILGNPVCSDCMQA